MLPSYLSETDLDALIQRALAEDVGGGDVTTNATVAPETPATAQFLAKADGVLAGLGVAEQVFAAVDPELAVAWTLADGDRVATGTRFGTVTGRARSILVAERLALNLMQRMSGIATYTRRMVDAIYPHDADLLDTRKTAPGLRLLDKWAVLLGGGTNHRIGLFDQILIKDNHIAAAGGVTAAVEAARAYLTETQQHLSIEVEARTLDEVRELLAGGGVDIVLLDNMAHLRPDGTVDTTRLAEAVALVAGRMRTEASGNVTLASVHAIAATRVDAISCGALTHSVTALDLSLKIELG